VTPWRRTKSLNSWIVGNPEAIQKRVLVQAADFYLLAVASSLTFLLGAM
jgi:hypothetical protein